VRLDGCTSNTVASKHPCRHCRRCYHGTKRQGEGGLLAVITNAEQEAFIVNLKNSVASGIGPYFLQLFYWIGHRWTTQHIQLGRWRGTKLLEHQDGRRTKRTVLWNQGGCLGGGSLQIIIPIHM